MSKRRPEKNAINSAVIYKISLFLATILPSRIMRAISKMVARVWYNIDRETVRCVKKNLSRVIGNDPKLLAQTSKELFLNYATYLADWAKLITINSSTVFSSFAQIEGKEIFEKAHARGKGIIILAAHLGNWELGGLVFTHSGMPFNVITAKDEAVEIANIRANVRAFHNIKTITIDQGTFFFIDIINALNRNEAVAMLIDRYNKNNGVRVDFFGEKTYFPTGPVLLAKATGATIIPAFTVLAHDGKYRSILNTPIEMTFTGDKDHDTYTNVSKIAHAFENYILQYPNQWYNFTSIWE